MADPLLGEVRVFAAGFVPRGWAPCDGRVLSINQNSALFSLLGFTYGGDGRTTFALPDLRGRVPVHRGGSHQLGQVEGEQAHTLTVAETPIHTHAVNGTTTQATTPAPGTGVTLATSAGAAAYQVPEGLVAMSDSS